VLDSNFSLEVLSKEVKDIKVLVDNNALLLVSAVDVTVELEKFSDRELMIVFDNSGEFTYVELVIFRSVAARKLLVGDTEMLDVKLDAVIAIMVDDNEFAKGIVVFSVTTYVENIPIGVAVTFKFRSDVVPVIVLEKVVAMLSVSVWIT
jgi:hypothetical protein